MKRMWTAIGALALLLPAPGLSAETRKVTVGPQFEAGGFHRFWFGDGYRDLWTTPVEVEVLDLRSFAGGLTPVRKVGQAQTLGLALRGADGRAYTFRSLHKHPERLLPEPWRDRWPAKLLQDRTSATHPAAALIVASLAEAAGVAHTAPRLVVMPDDPGLGEFRQVFAGEIGTIDEFPLPTAEGRPGFAGASEIVGMPELWKRWLQGPEQHVDARALLRARLLELWLDNYDRHRGQWRFLRLPGQPLWQPLPEDPDMALVRHEGVAMAQARRHAPTQLRFSASYPGALEGPLRNAFEVDRWLLAGLDLAAWQQGARELQARLTDAAIERAARSVPVEWQALDAARTTADLKARREGLVDYATRVYRYLAREVDVQATDLDERVSVARGADDSLEVSVAAGEHEPWYRRRFVPGETDEVRIYLRGGRDQVVRTGAAGGPIRLRVIGGADGQVVDDSAAGGTEVWPDGGPVEVRAGSGTRTRAAWSNPAPVEGAPWLEPRSFGAWTVGDPVLGYNSDAGALLGFAGRRTAWGFRAEPAAQEHEFSLFLATAELTGRAHYAGVFRRPASRFGWQFEAFGSGVEHLNFFGFGNESPATRDKAAYRAHEDVLLAAAALRYEVGERLDASFGPELRYSSSGGDEGSILASQGPPGSGRYGQVALRARLAFDTRGRAEVHAPTVLAAGQIGGEHRSHVSGLRVEAETSLSPAAWDATSTHGAFDARVIGYAGSARAHVALRVGGRRAFGDYPWFEAATLGGENNRGFASHRFAGDGVVYGTLSGRLWLGKVHFPLIPMRVGLLALADGGRVWLDGEASDKWHTSAGGGLLLHPLASPLTLHVVGAHSKEGNRFFFGIGYPF